MNLLLLSINNTRTRLLMEDPTQPEGLRELWLEPTAGLRGQELGALLTGQDLVLSSVVPQAEASLAPALAKLNVVRVTAALRLNFDLAGYEGRATLGADRIADLAAVAQSYALPAVILDLGTAVTVDVLDADRHYRGGMIAPGLRLFMDYLADRTAQLPRIGMDELTPALGQTTRGAIGSGAWHGFAGQCQGLLEAGAHALGGARVQSVIVTGGDAALFHSTLRWPGAVVHHGPLLAYQGMRLLGRLNLPSL